MHNRIFMAQLNPFALFKKGYIYGEILLYLFDNPESRCSINDIRKNISKATDSYLEDSVSWLLEDKLIVKETFKIKNSNPPLQKVDSYRISYQGFAFIKDLKDKRNSRIFNSVSIGIACLSIAVSSVISIINANSVAKVEITKFPYRLNIKARDTAPPIVNPHSTANKTIGKSSRVHGKPN